MSILTCQIGQCGNQLGQAFYDRLAQELETSDTYHLLSGFRTHFTFNDSKKMKEDFITSNNSPLSIPVANSIIN